MKNILLTAAIALCALGSNSCKDQPPQPDLPPYTETGENTFGCYIDGVPFAIFRSGGGFTITKTTFIQIPGTGEVFFNFVNESPRWEFSIGLLIPDYIPGIYLSNGTSGIDSNVSFFFDLEGMLPTGSSIFSSNRENFITVDINKAINNKHYAGTFSGELINSDGKVISITDGRFDIKK